MRTPYLKPLHKISAASRFLQEGTGIWTYGVRGILQLIFIFCQNCYLFILTEKQQIFYAMALDMFVSMKSLTLPLIGDEKCVAKRIPPVVLGTSPEGDTLKFEI
jgi:hypothetical protein